MEITALIAQHLIDVHMGNNWTEVDLSGALSDVTVEEATTITNASPNTIAAILHHITYWNRRMVGRINGEDFPESTVNGFDVPQLHSLEDWQQLKDDNLASAQGLATAIRGFDKDKLEVPILPGYSTAYKNLQGSVEHVHYHLGQIVIIKQLLRHGK
ncbi:DinB superfamily protein [Chitinophaga sp. CF118]|uniref:DinB family protein n=1 Tax=Chitinophaga sp. CF118 TaxID=1884367 RepID=UPI0008F0CE6D|nr:DinB family protein [Chitinophaga sp. CF118]SFD88216.1 DinB superfamily protein [Chitinophaga sp. CF118]